jgi:RNA polymerase sigma-70 factor (ECF subfamily)
MNIETLYQNHKNELINYSARIVSSRQIAEDIIQESYIVLLHESKKQHIENPRGFLIRVTRNLAYDYLKRKKIIENYSQAQYMALDSTIESPSVEQLASDDQCLEMVRQVIDELPPRCRETFILHKIYGMSYFEVAQHIGISESGVEKHMMKGLHHCRKRLTNFLPEKMQMRSSCLSVV